jgi:hypothetical protein
MDARPVRRYRIPRYPTKLRVLAEPELLARHVPAAWRKRAEVAGTAVLLALGGPLGCDSGPPAVVAPLFEHGDGRGSTGCVVVSPPVFLSEEEALQVIQEELAQSRIVLSKAGTRQSDLDGVDPTRKVAVEFVSDADYDEFGRPRSWFLTVESTLHSHDPKALAKSPPSWLKSKASGMHLGVFYDPVAKWNARAVKEPPDGDWGKVYAAAQEEAKAQSRELLREQVRDFVDWLKAQGAI